MTTATACNPKFYHYVTLRRADGEVDNFVFCSEAGADLDAAAAERCRLAAKYHPHKLVSISTHNIGAGPAYGEPGHRPQCGPES
jgi:hypothetical protein